MSIGAYKTVKTSREATYLIRIQTQGTNRIKTVLILFAKIFQSSDQSLSIVLLNYFYRIKMSSMIIFICI